MKKIWICLLVLAVAAIGNGIAVPQAYAAKPTAKKESAAKSTGEKTAREIYGKIQILKGLSRPVRLLETGSTPLSLEHQSCPAASLGSRGRA